MGKGTITGDDLISVIVPVLDREQTIGRCIEFVLKQSYHNFELIIIDDGSVDKTLSVCEKYRAEDDRIRIYPSTKLGVAYSRNDGLDVAKGKYIAFLDSDDYVEPDYLEKLYKAITRDDSEVAMCLFTEVFSDKHIVNDYFNCYNDDASQYRLLRDTLYGKAKGAYSWGKLWLRDFITRRFRGFSYCEDTVFLFENLVYEEGICVIVKEVLCYYDRHEDSITGQENAGHLYDTLRAAKLIYNLSRRNYPLFIKPACSLQINAAFYAYLQNKTGDEEFKRRLDKLCLKVIRKYRTKALFDGGATVKTKCACLLSFFSMRLVKAVYTKARDRHV